jgi:hypothetical protein
MTISIQFSIHDSSHDLDYSFLSFFLYLHLAGRKKEREKEKWTPHTALPSGTNGIIIFQSEIFPLSTLSVWCIGVSAFFFLFLNQLNVLYFYILVEHLLVNCYGRVGGGGTLYTIKVKKKWVSE